MSSYPGYKGWGEKLNKKNDKFFPFMDKLDHF